MERTLVIVKPDGVQRGLIGEVISRFERRGIRLIGLKMIHIDEALAERHYGVHKGKPFYPGLIRYITSAPVVVMVWEGPNVIDVVRHNMGATDPVQAAPGTLRADYCVEIRRNLVHGSDGPETAVKEIELFFTPEELIEWKHDLEPWIFE